jgi:uncharacterized protein YcbX
VSLPDIARIAALYSYPVKSAGGTEHAAATLTEAGLDGDRLWMIVTPEGRFLTQRELPRLALLAPALSADTLLLRFPGAVELAVARGRPGSSCRVRVWKDDCAAFDEGDAAAEWLGQLLDRPCRLVRFDPAEPRLSDRAWTGALPAPNRFTDGFPLLVLGAASLRDLNSRLPAALPVNRFRPNLLLEGLEAYDEDRIDELHCGAIRLKLVKPCTRCSITTTNQDLGSVEGEEPLRTLKTYRYDAALRGVCFGQNVIIAGGVSATLRRGQEFGIRWRYST